MARMNRAGFCVVLLLLVPALSASTGHDPGQYNKEVAPYVAFLKTQKRGPVDYILDLFEKYDIVILCERFHPETTQYDLIYNLIKDKKFTDKVGHVFTEIGTSTNNAYLHDFMSTDGLSDAEADRKVMHLFRNLFWMPVWETQNFFDFLKRLYALNRSLQADLKIKISFSDMPFSWEGMNREKYASFSNSLVQRDQVMAEQIIEEFKEILRSTQSRKKALVIMNYRHAFNDRVKNAKGEKANNAGRYIFEAFPGRVANVMINSVALLPGSDDRKAVTAPICDGKWDAAFRIAGNPDLGFDFKENVFGADHFDYFPFFKHDYTYHDVFTGFVFFGPLEKHKMVSGIPDLLRDGYDKVILERMAIAGSPVEESKAAEFIAEIETRHETSYDNLPVLMGRIRSWLSQAEDH